MTDLEMVQGPELPREHFHSTKSGHVVRCDRSTRIGCLEALVDSLDAALRETEPREPTNGATTCACGKLKAW